MNKEKILNNMVYEIMEEFYNKGEYEDTPELNKAVHNVNNLCYDKTEISGINFDLDEAIIGVVLAAEKQGFMLGFKEAIRIYENPLDTL